MVSSTRLLSDNSTISPGCHRAFLPLWAYRERFGAEQGCLGFVVSRSAREAHLWLLTGHWSSPLHMTAHFCGEHMSELVSTLVGLRAHLSFASFSKVLPETLTDVC